MLANRKKNRGSKPHTIDNFVETVSEIHEPQKKPAKSDSDSKKESPVEPMKLLGAMKTCNIGQSPEVQPRDLLNL